jgi:predicted amidophosphoribosyltransferase
MYVDYALFNFCSFCQLRAPKSLRACPSCGRKMRSTNFKNRNKAREGQP